MNNIDQHEFVCKLEDGHIHSWRCRYEKALARRYKKSYIESLRIAVNVTRACFSYTELCVIAEAVFPLVPPEIVEELKKNPDFFKNACFMGCTYIARSLMEYDFSIYETYSQPKVCGTTFSAIVKTGNEKMATWFSNTFGVGPEVIQSWDNSYYLECKDLPIAKWLVRKFRMNIEDVEKVVSPMTLQGYWTASYWSANQHIRTSFHKWFMKMFVMDKPREKTVRKKAVTFLCSWHKRVGVNSAAYRNDIAVHPIADRVASALLRDFRTRNKIILTDTQIRWLIRFGNLELAKWLTLTYNHELSHDAKTLLRKEITTHPESGLLQYLKNIHQVGYIVI